MRSRLLAGLLIVGVAGLTDSRAHATIFDFTITSPSNTETFRLDDTTGLAEVAYQNHYVSYVLVSDTLGNTGAYFGDATTHNSFGVGIISRGVGTRVITDYNYGSPITLYPGIGNNITVTDGEFLNLPTGQTVLITAVHDVPAVPEPATWALMLSGIGVAGAAAVRRVRVC